MPTEELGDAQNDVIHGLPIFFVRKVAAGGTEPVFHVIITVMLSSTMS